MKSLFAEIFNAVIQNPYVRYCALSSRLEFLINCTLSFRRHVTATRPIQTSYTTHTIQGDNILMGVGRTQLRGVNHPPFQLDGELESFCYPDLSVSIGTIPGVPWVSRHREPNFPVSRETLTISLIIKISPLIFI